MRTDSSMRPAGALATAAVPTLNRATAADSVRTELPSHRTVTATAAAAPKQAPTATARPVTHQVVIDSAAAAVVYQDIDERTNTVVRQFPAEALLRRRAYLRTLDAQRAQAEQQRSERDKTV
jgi:hypothetical protein